MLQFYMSKLDQSTAKHYILIQAHTYSILLTLDYSIWLIIWHRYFKGSKRDTQMSCVQKGYSIAIYICIVKSSI